ncbi:MAG: T9SS type A sorting domain-containing protein [Saprospiraceae bacterium]|nr:T9SS type A sorting domain-containing protein [Saprospiraceae bacterium]
MQVKNIILFILFWGVAYTSFTQNSNCNPVTAPDSSSYEGSAFFNYGTIAKSKSQKYQTAVAIGQNFVGFTENNINSTYIGFYGRYLLPPFALKVNATQGDLLDRIQITWTVDGLGPSPNEGFNIYRDGIFLATVNANIRNYNDFNVIAGVAYTYSVRGINAYGEGSPSYALGFQVPNGVVTGWIRTKSGGPVPDAVVTLMPMQGFSAKFGAMDAATASVEGDSTFLPANENWTMTFWIKTDSASNQAKIISVGEISLFIRAKDSGPTIEGIEVATSPAAAPFLSATFDGTARNEWVHVALSFEDATGLMKIYLNGALTDQSSFDDNTSMGGGLSNEVFFKLGNIGDTGRWNGKIDELRIYSILLNELDFAEIMHGTASSLTDGLTYYWKMDEELGEKSYDLKNRVKLYFCGAAFDVDRPPVRTAGKTNSQGYYRIESASYGTGTTFLAEPSKSFYLQKSVKFTRSQSSNVTIPNFALPKRSTIELWVNNAGANGIQTILSKKAASNDFKVFLEPSGIDQILKISLNGSTHGFGLLGSGYQHLAITIDSTTNNVQVYKNSISLGSHTFGGTLGNLSDVNRPWRLGVHDNGSILTDYYNGLIDEFAVYNAILTSGQINGHFRNTRNMQEQGLYVYYPINEGAGNRISNAGSLFLDFGSLNNCEWSSFAPNQVTEPHEFAPKTRQVTLNPSVTSVDQVDFVDNSTVPVSGYVRYKNTDCFAQNVEILVNNTRFNPPIFTDSTGRFVIDFDPGATARLTPKLEDHVFMPAFWEVSNVNSPRSGIVFNDVTVRRVSGIIAGGSNPTCKKSIMREPVGVANSQGTICRVQVKSIDGCFVRTITIDNVEGEYEFDGLPPLERMTVAVTSHSDGDIRTAFQVQGGSTVNLTKRDTVIDFIYIAPPIPEITSGLETFPGCSPAVIVIDKGENKTINIRLKEVYAGGACYLDTASFNIINGFSDTTQDTVMSGGNLQYTFRVGSPNPSPPYLKTLQIIGTTEAGRKGSIVTQAIITGTKEKLPSFTTKLPERPFLVLHDPPGDGSYAFLEKDSSVCYTTSISLSSDDSAGGGTVFNVIPKVSNWVGFGFATELEARPILGNSVQFKNTYTRTSDSTFQTCLQTTQRISTDDGDLIVGGERGGDVFMGTAQNIIFANVDEVTFDNCVVNVVESVEVSPGDYATTFIYSEFNIRNYVIPNLTKLLSNPSTTLADDISQSIARWQTILANNDARKSTAELLKNISFDAGASYEYSETNQITKSSIIIKDTARTLNVGIIGGFFLNDAGGTMNVDASFSSSFGQTSENNTQYGNTIGYVLKDNDPGDFFSIDIGLDSAYLTPTFKLRAGQSSCPWEPGTANREKPNLQIVPNADGTSAFSAINVPANESAVFKMLLGNESATNEDWTYGFTAIAGSNPDGAIIKLNGQPLNNNTIQYIVPFGTSIPITMTVDRGPIAYEYNNLKVALVSECEMARNFALSLPLGVNDDTLFFSSINLGVDFIRPCSEVKINVPEQNWVVINNDPEQSGTKRLITIIGYDLSAPDFQRIKLQYRPSNGNGTWFNIVDTFQRYNPEWSGFAALPIPKPPVLRPDFTQFSWETAGIADGNYEIRAIAECDGDASDKPGYSEIIKGRIDREPPSLIGRPQPSDGVYHVGDEISFTFNKHINCAKLNPVDDVLLIDTETGDVLDISITCFENKIILEPINLNKFYENKILRAELHNIEDLAGNTSTYLKWEFYVDRNELAWLSDSIEIVKFVDETKTFSSKIHNRGGYPVPYVIDSIPDWLHVFPDRGTLVANEIEEIFFTVKNDMDLGDAIEDIVLITQTGLNPFFMGGTEPLNIKARNLCRPETWVLNPAGFNIADYDFSMNFIVQLNIEGALSLDENDIVGAYVNGQLRGIAKIEYQPSLNKYLAFLTVYSNQNTGETIKFQIWDASDCKLYAYAMETFTFKANDVKGTINSAIILHTTTTLLRKIFLNPGWNWISMNLDLTPNTTNGALSSLSSPSGATIKSQGPFSNYSAPLNIWIGSLTTLEPENMYQYKSVVKDSLSIIGNYVDPALTPIALDSGWNWLGYLPTQSLKVNDALSSINASNGDIIKSQLHFAQYLDGTGWVGNLKTMNAPNGYLLSLKADDTLIYPDPLNFKEDNESDVRNLILPEYHGLTEISAIPPLQLPFAHWQVHPNKYEHNMNAIAIVVESGAETNFLQDGDEVAAFVNNEVRGSAKAIYIPQLRSYLIFMTIYANKEGELMTLKFYDASTNQEYDLIEKIDFKVNHIIGLVDNPEPWHLSTVTSSNDISDNTGINLYPNPFTTSLHLEYILTKSQDVKMNVKDVLGKIIDSKTISSKAGLNRYEWIPLSHLAGGTYFITLESGEGIYSHKVLYIK